MSALRFTGPAGSWRVVEPPRDVEWPARLALLAFGLLAALGLGGPVTAPLAAAPALDPAAQAATRTATPLVQLTPATFTAVPATATSPAGTPSEVAPSVTATTGGTARSPAPTAEGGEPGAGGGANAEGGAGFGAGTPPPAGPDDGSSFPGIAPPVLPGGASDIAAATVAPFVRRVGPFGVSQIVDDPAAASLWRAGTAAPLAEGGQDEIDWAMPARSPGGPMAIGLLVALFAVLTVYAVRGLWRQGG